MIAFSGNEDQVAKLGRARKQGHILMIDYVEDFFFGGWFSYGFGCGAQTGNSGYRCEKTLKDGTAFCFHERIIEN
ncbi:hypothetical protein GCM10027577_43290 [Spirosoma fluminis]